MTVNGKTVDPRAVGLRLYRIDEAEETWSSDAFLFAGGAAAVDTTLRRAAISGRVDIDGEIGDYFADVLNAEGDFIQMVALDRRSYDSLRKRWMRCRIYSDAEQLARARAAEADDGTAA